ncbi:MAG: helix-turn-helix domain-containing protein [Defluviitaleaceae bacterium]|nr:helix-turn-helix domain-containing protein [Defluviitaleaceae bacterium]
MADKIMIGEFIRRTRKQQGISQKALAEPFMTRSYLSKVENNKVVPGRDNLEFLLERLSVEPNLLSVFLMSLKEIEWQQVKDEINALLKQRNLDEAEKLISLAQANKEFMERKPCKQFLMSARAKVAIIKKEEPMRIMDMLMEAIKISIPVFKEQHIYKYLLSKEDIAIITGMGIVYSRENRLNDAIELLYRLKDNFDSRYMCNEAKGGHYPMLIYNLTKNLGNAEKYDEAIALCDVGIQACKDLGKLRFLPKIMINKAVSLHKIGDKETSKMLIRRAYHALQAYGDFESVKIIESYAFENKMDITFD